MATMGQVQKQASYWIFASGKLAGKLAPKNDYQNAEKQKRNSSSSSSSTSSSSSSRRRSSSSSNRNRNSGAGVAACCIQNVAH